MTVAVAPLPGPDVRRALENGAAAADALRARGLIHAAYLALQGQAVACPGALHLKLSAATQGRIDQ